MVRPGIPGSQASHTSTGACDHSHCTNAATANPTAEKLAKTADDDISAWITERRPYRNHYHIFHAKNMKP